MKIACYLLFLLAAFGLQAAGPPFWSNPWTTNRPPNPVLGNNDLAVSNQPAPERWEFYVGTTNKVARIGEVTNAVNNAITPTNGVTGAQTTNIFYSLMTTNESPWTNNGMFIYFKGLTPSNSAPLLIRDSDGSHFYGRSLWADPIDWLHQPANQPWMAKYYVQSNDSSVVEFGAEVDDDISPTYIGKYFGNVGIIGNSPYGLIELYAASNTVTHKWQMYAHAAYSSFILETNSISIFEIDKNGDLVLIKGVAYSWPVASKFGVLENDGVGNLTWDTNFVRGIVPTDSSIELSTNLTTKVVSIRATGTNSASITNAIGDILLDGATVSTGATAENYITGQGVSLLSTNRGSTNDLQINATTVAVGTNTILTTNGLTVTVNAVRPQYDIWNVRAWGAMGTNGDDTASIQAALDSGQNTIYAPAGHYLLTSPLLLRKGVNFIGEGTNTMLLGSNGLTTLVQIGIDLANRVERASIRDMSLWQSNVSSIGVYVLNSGGVTVERLNIYGDSSGSNDMRAIVVDGGNDPLAYCAHVTVQNNRCLYHRISLLLTNASSQITVFGNTFSGTQPPLLNSRGVWDVSTSGKNEIIANNAEGWHFAYTPSYDASMICNRGENDWCNIDQELSGGVFMGNMFYLGTNYLYNWATMFLNSSGPNIIGGYDSVHGRSASSLSVGGNPHTNANLTVYGWSNAVVSLQGIGAYDTGLYLDTNVDIGRLQFTHGITTDHPRYTNGPGIIAVTDQDETDFGRNAGLDMVVTHNVAPFTAVDLRAMRIKYDGRVGISTLSPRQMLDVGSGGVRTDGTNYAQWHEGSYYTGIGITLSGVNPYVDSRVDRAGSGGFDVPMLRGYASNSVGGLVSKMVQFGQFGEMATSPTAPYLYYGYIGVGPTANYQSNSIRFYTNGDVVIPSQLAIGTNVAYAPLHVAGNVQVSGGGKVYGDGSGLSNIAVKILAADGSMVVVSNPATGVYTIQATTTNSATVTNALTIISVNNTPLGSLFTNANFLNGTGISITGVATGQRADVTIASTVDAGGTNSRQGGAALLTNIVNNPVKDWTNRLYIISGATLTTNADGTIGLTVTASGDAGGTNSRQGGTATLTNLSSNPKKDYTNTLYIISGATLTTNADGTVGFTATTGTTSNFTTIGVGTITVGDLIVSNSLSIDTLYVNNLDLTNPVPASMGGTGTNTSGASIAQILQWNGSFWMPSNAYWLPLAGGTVSGAVLSTSSSASNAPAANEFPTAAWVRSLFNNGLILYNSSSFYPDVAFTNSGEAQMYVFTNTIPATTTRTYTAPNAGDYIGGVTTTNTFSTLQGPILVNTYLQMSGGLGGPSLAIHPEIYYSFDGSNWLGDFDAPNLNITTGTNLYSWVVSFPKITGGTNFHIQRKFKVGTATGSTHPDLVIHIGTNNISGVNNASHIAIGGATGEATTSGITSNYITLATGTETAGSIIVTNSESAAVSYSITNATGTLIATTSVSTATAYVNTENAGTVLATTSVATATSYLNTANIGTGRVTNTLSAGTLSSPQINGGNFLVTNDISGGGQPLMKYDVPNSSMYGFGGDTNNTGVNNTVLGLSALYQSSPGHDNTILGNNAATRVPGNYNVALGTLALSESNPNWVTNSYNVAIGYSTMLGSIVSNCVGIGRQSMMEIAAQYSIGIGDYSLYHTYGNYNTAIGSSAGRGLGLSESNIYIGAWSGPQAFTSETNKLYIGGGYGSPFIYGDMTTSTLYQHGTNCVGTLVATNGSVGTGTVGQVATYRADGTLWGSNTPAFLLGPTMTSWAHASSQIVDMSTDNIVTGTNATSGNVTILLTNLVAGKYFTMNLTADGTPRTISFFTGGGTMTWISTNATSSATNLLITASKTAVACGRVWPGAGTTNVTLFAVVQP